MKKTVKYILCLLILVMIFTTEYTAQNVYASEGETATEEITTAAEDTDNVNNEKIIKFVPKRSIMSKLSPAASKVVLLDPGHCLEHLGARANGLKEEEVVLDIAKACKNELNKYGNISVYMTRTTNKCCSSLHLGDCLTARNNYAKRLDADFLVSMHINADANTKKAGAMILPAYESGYNDRVRVKTQALGRKILSNLHSLGIKDRGFWLRKSEYERYSNGALTDYYSIVRNGVLNKIPSLIVEHGYVTNAADCKKYFNTKDKRQELGITDAKSIASYYKLKKNTITGTFFKKNGAVYYVTENNKKAKGWVKHNGKWYYFSRKNGKMRKGFISINKNKFYLNTSTGALKTGWFKVNGAKYLAKGNGTIVKNTAYSDGIKTYLFNVSGKKYTRGTHKIKGRYYYVSPKTETIIKSRNAGETGGSR